MTIPGIFPQNKAVIQDAEKERTINKDKQKGSSRFPVRLAILLLLLGGMAFLLYESGLIQFFLNKKRMLAFVESFGPLGFIGFILLQAAQVVAAPIPGEVTGLLGGYLYGPVPGIVLSTLGLTLGSYIAFILSRKFGRPFVEKFVDAYYLTKFDYLLLHKGVFLVFILFLIPGVPKDYLCYILGLGRLSTMEFLVIGGVGRLLGTVLLTLGGDYLRHEEYRNFCFLVAIALVFILITIMYKNKIEQWFRVLHERYDKKEG